jgi:type IV pilus biogenesis protein PilP
VTQVAAVAPRTVQPSIPSTASVARQATVTNAINLRRINLIGVYGKPSNRRALVRLSNGRYQKVQVGDRLDGGRVAAIGDSELRYSKNGRNVVLEMPEG